MCFGRSKKSPPESSPPARIPNNQTKNFTHESNHAPPNTKKSEDSNKEQGESLSLDLFAQRQKRLKEAYPDGNIPKELQRFNESGMVQGNLGGPLGGGAGMAMTGGF